MRPRWPTNPAHLLLLICLGGVASSASAGEQSLSVRTCFEIITAQPASGPRKPFLINKCTGETWILAKSRCSSKKRKMPKPGYYWVRVSRQDTSAVSKSASEPPGVLRDRCFEFVGRRFCEGSMRPILDRAGQ